jgi:hypothetical protein
MIGLASAYGMLIRVVPVRPAVELFCEGVWLAAAVAMIADNDKPIARIFMRARNH